MQMKPCIKAAFLMSLLLATASAGAYQTFSVSLDTSSISSTTEEVVFELVDGDGVVDNSLLLSKFTFGGGMVAGAADYLGTTGVTGDLSSSISMDDSGALALFAQPLIFGSSLTFMVTASNTFSGSGAPDALSMALYTPDLSACLSDDQTSCVLLQLDLTGGTLRPASFILNAASAQQLPAPVVTVGTVPEPASIVLLATAIMSVVTLRGRKAKGKVD
jgi:hypothetical protein